MAWTPGAPPLTGISVLELGGIGPAPFAAAMLAEYGAQVLRVERPAEATTPELDAARLDRSRTTVAVDLKSAAGRDAVRTLARHSDVLLEAYRPGVAERLGLGPQEVHARNPGCVYARMTGWGQHGPRADTVGHDITYAALSGAVHVTGTPEKPLQAVNLVADFAGGALYVVAGVLAALLARDRGAGGQVIDAAMVDGATHLMTMMHGMAAAGTWRDERQANVLDGGAPYYDTYACAEGRHVAVGAIEPPFYAALLDGLGLTGALPGQQDDRAHWPEHRRAIAAAFARRPRQDWVDVFEGTLACVGPVNSLAEARADPHLRARGVFPPGAPPGQPRVAPVFSGTPTLPPTPARGGTTAQVRDALLAWGLTERQCEDLLDGGAIAPWS